MKIKTPSERLVMKNKFKDGQTVFYYRTDESPGIECEVVGISGKFPLVTMYIVKATNSKNIKTKEYPYSAFVTPESTLMSRE